MFRLEVFFNDMIDNVNKCTYLLENNSLKPEENIYYSKGNK